MKKDIHLLISQKAEEIKEDVINIRRHLHMYPELSGEEKETGVFIAKNLESLGMEVTAGVGGYGVTGLLKGKREGAVVAWSADMDACALCEENDVPYRSRVDGKMHSCGHDAHMAIALGMAKTLSSVKDDLSGSVKFIFQPHEEGCIGAKRMIADGVLDDTRPVSVYGLHQGSLGAGQTYMQAGEISIHYGTALYGIDVLNINISAKRPKLNAWAEQEMFIYRLSRINCLYNKYGRNDLSGPVDFKILNKEADDNTGRILIKAQFRYAKQEYRDVIRGELIKIIDEYIKQSGFEVTLEYIKSIPPVYNDTKDCEEAVVILKNLVGDNLITIHDTVPPHGVDDFSIFQNELSGLFFFLGSANLKNGIMAKNHTSTFDIDEGCLEFGVKTMSSFLFEILKIRGKHYIE